MRSSEMEFRDRNQRRASPLISRQKAAGYEKPEARRSPEGAPEHSPGRKPGVGGAKEQSPEGAKENSLKFAKAANANKIPVVGQITV